MTKDKIPQEKKKDNSRARLLVMPKGNSRCARATVEFCKGRKLRKKEVVHHIDGNPENNDPNNLAIFATNAEHLTTHGEIRRQARKAKKRKEYLALLKRISDDYALAAQKFPELT